MRVIGAFLIALCLLSALVAAPAAWAQSNQSVATTPQPGKTSIEPIRNPALAKDTAVTTTPSTQNTGAATSTAEQARTADIVRTALILALLAIIPAILICSTSFVRIIVVLSMIRHAFGMPETPPNQVLISLAIFLTAFSMLPTFEAVNTRALQPFLDGQLTIEQAVDRGGGPLGGFLLRQVGDQDIKAIYDISHKPLPEKAADVGLMQLIPAFMLHELRVAFRIGFVVLLPFLLIDLVVSSILLALGMLMVPPSTISLPIKVLMFVLIDGWSLVLEGVLGSFR